MRLLLLIPFLLFVCAQAASGVSDAQTKTIRVNWKERRPLEQGYMAFRVRTIYVGTRRWSVAGEFANRTPHAIGVNRRRPGHYAECRMSIVRYVRIKTAYGQINDRQDFLATTFAPRLPSVLRPGMSWKGTFGGRGVLPKGVLLNICFGYFTIPGKSDGFSWVTDHTFRS